MALSDIAAAGRTLLQLVGTLQNLGDNFYKSSAAWDGFPGEVILLQAKHEALQGSLEKYGLLDEMGPSVLDLLERAKKLLQQEEMRLQKRNERVMQKGFTSKFKPRFGRLGEIFFPEKVGIAIRNATRAYESIEVYITSKQMGDQFAKEEMKSKFRALSFRNLGEEHYVQLGCEEKVCSALKEAGADYPIVVLLYGGPGTGKTTVLRHICLSFENDKSVFHQVVFLECGMSEDQQDKEILLLQKLGWDETIDLPQASNQDVRSQRLQNLLKHRKLLVVLDDVCESALLLRLLHLSGPGVKYLVSSQNEKICRILGGRSKSFKVDDLEESVAMQILATHAGFPNQCIPDKLKDEEVVRETFKQAGRIPLVLATLGAQIAAVAEEDAEDLEVWTCVSEKFVQYLHSKVPSKSIFGLAYSKTYWSALKQSIGGLNSEERHLFLLVCSCKSSSVLQHILHFFCIITIPNCDKVSFLQWKEKLKSINIVFEKDKGMLSVHSVTKKLVEAYMQEDQRLAVHSFVEKELSLLPCDSESMDQNTSVIITLVSLYLGHDFGKELGSKAGLDSVMLSDARRRAIEPVTELLILEVISRRSWAGELHKSAKQVFLQFVFNDAFDRSHMSLLLSQSEGVLAILQLLQNASVLEPAYWEKNSVRHISHNLFEIFEDATHPDRQLQAAIALTEVSYRDPGLRADMVQSTTIFNRLILCSSDDQNGELRLMAIKLLHAVLWVSPIADKDVLGHSNFSEWLVTSLSQSENGLRQRYAAAIIGNLAYEGESFRENLLNFPELLSSLVKYVRQDGNLELAAHAARAIGNVSLTENLTLLLEISSFPDLAESLAASLSPDKRSNGPLQAAAAAAINNLVWNDQAIMERFFNVPGLLNNLIKSMWQDANADLAAQATRIIQNFSTTNDPTMKGQLCSFPDLVKSLVASLFPDKTNGPLQVAAAKAIGSLGYNHDVNTERLLNFPGLLNSLVKSVQQEEDSNLAAQAATAIQNLSCTREVTKINVICSFPDLAESLVASLSPNKKSNGPLQVAAAAAINNLVWDHQANMKRFFNDSGLLNSLIKCVRHDGNSALAAQAARVIQNFSTTNDLTMKGQLCSFPDLVKSLAASLIPDKAFNGPLQVAAAKAIGNLGYNHDSNTEVLFNVPGLLNNLVNSMRQEDSDLAASAASAIQDWSCAEDFSLVGEICSFPKLAENLAKCLLPDMQSNGPLQVAAASAIGNLGCNHEANMERLFNVPGLLNSVVKSVRQDKNSALAERAARVIQNFSATNDLTMKGQLCSIPDLVESLAASLFPDNMSNGPLQANAAAAISNLGCNHQGNKERLFSVPRLLDSLVKAVWQDGNLDLAAEAAWAILHMVLTKDFSMKSEICTFPDLFESLAASFLPDKISNASLQFAAATCIGYLGANYQVNKKRLSNVPGFVSCFVKSVRQDNNLDLATEAPGPIQSLTITEAFTMKSEIFPLPYLVESLAASWLPEEMPNGPLRVATAGGVANIGSEHQENTEKLHGFRGLLASLVKVLQEERSSSFAKYATRAIASLASTNDPALQSEIISFPGLVESLRTSSSKAGRADFQYCAKMALASLGLGDQ